jgi:DNA-directed RNA polymerase subunit RPC12/RpoP
MAKLQLWLVCRSCGREFDTRLRLDRKSFERGTMAANYHACPHCGERLTYKKAEYLTRED